jgi:hypothetical protein
MDYNNPQTAAEIELENELRSKYGQLWNTTRLQEDFKVESFCAPFVAVIRKADNKKGTLEFTHMPRWYFNFIPD